MSFLAYCESRVPLIDDYLKNSLEEYRKTSSQRFSGLIEAIHYSLAGGGKRLRPLLVLASAETLRLAPEAVLPVACAVEYIHTYSLIHDDLPALDDDDTRRGRPSNHIQFGEATAILAGDALLTESVHQFLKVIPEDTFPMANVLSSLDFLIHAAGIRGMVGGQYIDVTLEKASYTLPEVEFIHIHKTGAMIMTSVLLPAKLVGLEDEKLRHLKRFGEALGLAFQVSDDILDSESRVRYSRGPRKKARPAYSEIMAPSDMRQLMNGLVDTAIAAAKPLGDKSAYLTDIAEFVRTRKS